MDGLHCVRGSVVKSEKGVSEAALMLLFGGLFCGAVWCRCRCRCMICKVFVLDDFIFLKKLEWRMYDCVMMGVC